MTTTTTDRIEKQITLNAPRTRVWRALADSKEFGGWFGMTVDGPFAPGPRVRRSGNLLQDVRARAVVDCVDRVVA